MRREKGVDGSQIGGAKRIEQVPGVNDGLAGVFSTGLDTTFVKPMVGASMNSAKYKFISRSSGAALLMLITNRNALL